MKFLGSRQLTLAGMAAVVFGVVFSVPARLLDNFNDNVKTGWQDFTFSEGFGLPVETGGQFKFVQPPANQPIFSASTKVSDVFLLADGRTVEFRVDMVSGNGRDAYAALAFIPTSSSVNTLAGYAIAKSSTDILVTKGLNRYLFSDSPTPALKNENVTLVLRLTGSGSNVLVNVKVLDKDNNDAVLFEKTVVDTPAADILAVGTDDPAAPYTGTGQFVLYCYQDFDPTAAQPSYEVVYDNAEAFVLENVVLDDFNDNSKTAWEDFSFVSGFGLPVETGGQFRFIQPPANQSIFSASTKTSRSFDLVDGERVEFSIDLVSGNGKDSFAVLAFIPLTSTASSLAGYGFAKSTTDILVTKGINKYFYNENIEPPLRNENVTLALALTVRSNRVHINARLLDKENQDAVLFEKNFIDTPEADALADGSDSPAAAFIGRGRFVLYEYQDFDRNAPQDSYEVIYDNARVAAAPLAANTPPVISEVRPLEYANFLPATNVISFKVTDDKALANDRILVLRNGLIYSTTNGLAVAGTGNTRTVTLGGLATDTNYEVELRVTDSENATTSVPLYFDTFASTNLVVEVEDYNGGGGEFNNNPIPVPEGSGPQPNAYANWIGLLGVDYFDTRTTPQNAPYRPDDLVRMQHSLDVTRQKFTDAGGTQAGVFDYDVGDIAAGEWLNYTRIFPAGSYEVYLRESLVNGNQVEAVLEKVLAPPNQPNPPTQTLGSFLGLKTGFLYRNFPLTDGLGKTKIILRLSGQETFRLRQLSAAPADGGILQNYLIFVPVADPGVQRATVAGISPAADAIVGSARPVIEVQLQNRDTVVVTNSIVLRVNGAPVTPAMVAGTNGVTLTYPISPLPPRNSVVTAQLTYRDNLNVTQTNDWSFTLAYKAVDPAHGQPGPGLERGFNFRLVQAPEGSALENNLDRAEAQLAPNSTFVAVVSTNLTVDLINFNLSDDARGFFENDALVPGIDVLAHGGDDFATETLAYLELPAGVVTFGVVSDDGYKLTSGRTLTDQEPEAALLGYRSGGTANETFEVVVPQAGLYPFRFVWYQRGGQAFVEWFTVDPISGARVLINDATRPSAIKAYRTIAAAPAVQLESTAALGSAFVGDPSAVVDLQNRTVTVPRSAAVTQFFRLRSTTALRITGIRAVGNQIIISYQ